MDIVELEQLYDLLELSEHEVQDEELDVAKDIAEEIVDTVDGAKETTKAAPCNYVTESGIFNLNLGQAER